MYKMQTSLFFYVMAVIAVTMAQPINTKVKQAQIVKYEYINHGNGTYNFYYETSDGNTREENASRYMKPNGEETIVVRGSYSFEGDDGIMYTIRYIADENGFRPEGTHLHTGFNYPLEPIPEDGEVVIGNRIDPKLIGTLLGGGLG